MPIPIQSASLTERLRKFFRIRGKTTFSLDEVVAPVVIVQDLTLGPYQSGVTPAAGQSRLQSTLTDDPFAFAMILNDKAGSITPVLDRQFDERSFSFTWAEILNISLLAADLTQIRLVLATRAAVLAAGVPTGAESLIAIQNSDGSQVIPVEIFTFDSVTITGGILWRGTIGDNLNTPGNRQTFDPMQPNITIGPKDALVFTTPTGQSLQGNIQINVRGFYQEQPA